MKPLWAVLFIIASMIIHCNISVIMQYDWIILCIKKGKYNGKSCEWILHKIFNIFIFQRFLIKSIGVFGVVSPYLTSHVLNLILHLTHNSYNIVKSNLIINSFILNIKLHNAWSIISHKILIINSTKTSKISKIIWL